MNTKEFFNHLIGTHKFCEPMFEVHTPRSPFSEQPIRDVYFVWEGGTAVNVTTHKGTGYCPIPTSYPPIGACV